MPSPRTQTPAATQTPKAKKADTFFVAYSRVDGVLVDLRIYGRKEPAADFALEQEPAWRLVEVAKGDSVPAAIAAKASK